MNIEDFKKNFQEKFREVELGLFSAVDAFMKLKGELDKIIEEVEFEQYQYPYTMDSTSDPTIEELEEGFDDYDPLNV